MYAYAEVDSDLFVFLGVQRYTIEGRVACSIDWFYKDIHSTLYNVIIFGSSFFLPVLIIISTNIIIFYVVSSLCLSRNDKFIYNQLIQWKLKLMIFYACKVLKYA